MRLTLPLIHFAVGAALIALDVIAKLVPEDTGASIEIVRYFSPLLLVTGLYWVIAGVGLAIDRPWALRLAALLHLIAIIACGFIAVIAVLFAFIAWFFWACLILLSYCLATAIASALAYFAIGSTYRANFMQ